MTIVAVITGRRLSLPPPMKPILFDLLIISATWLLIWLTTPPIL